MMKSNLKCYVDEVRLDDFRDEPIQTFRRYIFSPQKSTERPGIAS